MTDSGQIKYRVARNLAYFRKLRGLRQKDLAAMAGMTREGYEKIECCESYPQSGNCARLCNALGIDVAELFVKRDFDNKQTRVNRKRK